MIRSVLISPIKRYFVTKRMFAEAKNIANTKGKSLMMIGDPCSGNYFQFMSRMFPNSEHGDVTVDLYGCEDCHRMDINDMDAWGSFDDGSFVVMESGTLGFSNDLGAVLREIRRVSGGDFLSAGGNRGLAWELFLYKTYSEDLKYSMDPFDSRRDEYYTGRILGRKGSVREKF
ncbi:MAG: hypothetical protein CMA88_03920 [Euryarchaeota archaeon]|nr:hypothetical protein [Euryarchaeota archaeon]|tara:strand:- start:1406 stop:1924 length:519 start_codon:yes stop_codon:yes gene_type:complete